MALILVLTVMIWGAGCIFAPLPVNASIPPRYDVVVIGAEPEGIAAAIGAARAGASVLLLEKRDRPGGLYTYGWLNQFDMNYGPAGQLLTRGVFEEFYRRMGGTSFDVGLANQVFKSMLDAEKNICVLYSIGSIQPEVDSNGCLSAVLASTPNGYRRFEARIFVDATQDADIAAAAGVPYTIGGQDYGMNETMAATLVFKLVGVKWDSVRWTLRNDNDPFTSSDENSAWGFWSNLRSYQPSDPRLRVRGLNLGRQLTGSIMVNALSIFGVDGTDPASYRQGYDLAVRELPRIVAYLNQYVPCFAEAQLSAWAPELYVRETRHIQGEYILSINDVLGNRYFPDQIGVASYPVDIQATNPSNYGWAYGKPKMYSIPIRCLVPLRVENLLVCGRSASYSSLAAGSARVVPVGMVAGQAAGVTAAVSVLKGVSPRTLIRTPNYVKRVQGILLEQGAYLPEFNLSHAAAGHWAYPAVKQLQQLGLVQGAYNNQYPLDKCTTVQSFNNIVRAAFSRSYPTIPNPPEDLLPPGTAGPVTMGQAVDTLTLLLQYYSSHADEPFRPASSKLRDLSVTTTLTNAQVYTMLCEALGAAAATQEQG